MANMDNYQNGVAGAQGNMGSVGTEPESQAGSDP